MKRRTALAAAVGAVAAAGGAVLGWQAMREADTLEALWTLRLPTPDSEELVFQTLRGKPLLLNFWATWCAPCVVEMPLLASFYSAHKGAGWQVVGIAIDQAEPVKKFLREREIRFPVVLGSSEGLQLARALGNRAGGLPFSVAVSRDARIRATRLGALDAKTLSDWANGFS